MRLGDSTKAYGIDEHSLQTPKVVYCFPKSQTHIVKRYYPFFSVHIFYCIYKFDAGVSPNGFRGYLILKTFFKSLKLKNFWFLHDGSFDF